MQASTPPEAVAVEVAAAQPTAADSALISQLDAELVTPLPGMAYIVKIKLKELPPATSEGWALYVGDLRIPKYWTYEQGIYFKVFDPQFFEQHKAERLRFSQDGSTFTDARVKLGAPAPRRSRSAPPLPQQDELLR